jgi:hypothetical protein
MSQTRLPPSQPDACLIQGRKSRYKGGTVIAEDVSTQEEHLKRLRDPDGYRPDACGRCGHGVLHVHDYLERKPQGLASGATVRVIRFICANPACGATWRVLPAWLARHLWWGWAPVEQATMPPDPTQASAMPALGRTPPERTIRRWLRRLASSARDAVTLIVNRGASALKAMAEAVGLDATRQELVQGYRAFFGVSHGHALGSLAAVMDRLERGVRVM